MAGEPHTVEPAPHERNGAVAGPRHATHGCAVSSAGRVFGAYPGSWARVHPSPYPAETVDERILDGASANPASLTRRARRLAGRVYRRVKHMPERFLHGRRRDGVRSALARAGLPDMVVFVCQGNIYRSPYAAYVFEQALPGPVRQAVRVASAGFVGPNRACPADALAEAARQGITLSAHRSQLLAEPLVSSASLFVVVDPEQVARVRAVPGYASQPIVVLGDLDPRPIETRRITDPWGQSAEILTSSYRRIERCTAELAALVCERVAFEPPVAGVPETDVR